MNKQKSPRRIIGIFVFFLVMTLGFVEASAQNMDLCRRRVAGLEAELSTAREELAVKGERIQNLQNQLNEYKNLVAALEAKAAALNEQVIELRVTQTQLQADNRVKLEENARMLQQISDGREQAIKDRDMLITVLVKSSKKSALEKLVDALPSIAGIIALSIAR